MWTVLSLSAEKIRPSSISFLVLNISLLPCDGMHFWLGGHQDKRRYFPKLDLSKYLTRFDLKPISDFRIKFWKIFFLHTSVIELMSNVNINIPQNIVTDIKFSVRVVND